ncbi:hypothetical protein SynA15127_00581 [Synechococcus sp. A15-127]|nr:hypothetical protein SynA15127_00581 [Synechococcus sp. A15-127]
MSQPRGCIPPLQQQSDVTSQVLRCVRSLLCLSAWDWL